MGSTFTVYLTPRPTLPQSLTTCLEDIRNRMSRNFLKLNANKTEALLIGSNSTFAISQLTPPPPVIITQAKSLSVILDSTLSFAPHIHSIAQTALFHLCNISSPSLSQASTEILVNTFVTSCIDNCNALLSGIPAKLINRLQLIQNSAARIITCT